MYTKPKILYVTRYLLILVKYTRSGKRREGNMIKHEQYQVQQLRSVLICNLWTAMLQFSNVHVIASLVFISIYNICIMVQLATIGPLQATHLDGCYIPQLIIYNAWLLWRWNFQGKQSDNLRWLALYCILVAKIIQWQNSYDIQLYYP